MATTVKIQINATDTNNNNLYTTFGYINPNINDVLLLEFAKKINNFTSNTFKSVSKIETTPIATDVYLGMPEGYNSYIISSQEEDALTLPIITILNPETLELKYLVESDDGSTDDITFTNVNLTESSANVLFSTVNKNSINTVTVWIENKAGNKLSNDITFLIYVKRGES